MPLMCRQGEVQLLASRRRIRRGGVEIAKSPMLIPSFSSKGFSKDVRGLLGTMSEFITESLLVSAYDIGHGFYSSDDAGYPEIVFLDSGGYEATKDHELSELRAAETEEYLPREWDSDKCKQVRDQWLEGKPEIHTAVISFDHPKIRVSMREQIDNANEFHDRRDVIREFLIKPETKDQTQIQIKNVQENIGEISSFDIVGVTEKELGRSVLDRMKNLAKIRRAIVEVGNDTPIHVFGSLDTVLTPLYFVSGADLFDGLTWLRYAYIDGNTSYIHHSFPINGSFNNRDKSLHKVLVDNYYYLETMRDEFSAFVSSGGDFSSFSHHCELIERAYRSLIGEIGE